MSSETRSYAPPPALAALGQRMLWIGLAAAAVCVVGVFVDSEQFYRSYLVGYLLWVGVALGCLGFLCIHHLTASSWGLVLRRVLEAASRTLPYLLVLFIPIALGMHQLFEWSHTEAVEADALLRHKAPYLNSTFFLGRTVLFFAIWSALAYILSSMSARQDATGDPGLPRRMRMVSGPGLVLYGITASFAAVDWLMSLEPHWFSSMFGVYFMGGHGLSGMAFMILIGAWLVKRAPMNEVIGKRHFHDYGKLLFALVMLWAYFGISQFMIIWSGNLPEDITWYLTRTRNGWGWIALALVFFHFALPFLILLSRDFKRDADKLVRIAGLVLVMRWMDLYWQAAPAFHPEGLTLHWLDVAAPVAVGGIWFWLFTRELSKRSMVPTNDPFIEESLGDE